MKREGGFTLVEVMLTSVILALGTILLHQNYLRFAELYGKYVNNMRLESWVDDEMWAAREALVYNKEQTSLPSSGSVQIGPKTFDWTRAVQDMPGKQLYSIRMTVNWTEGNKPSYLMREIYASRRDII